MTRVALTRRWPRACEAQARQLYELAASVDDQAMSPGQLATLAAGCDVFCPTVTDVIDRSVLANAQCKLIANYGAGVGHIDLDAARELGIVVTNTPDVLTDATADLALMLILMACRRASEGERELREGRWAGWRPTHLMGQHVTGQTLGIVGYGRIGAAVAQRARQGFGMSVLANSRTGRSDDNASVASLSDVLQRSDIISIHCPGGAANRHLIGRKELASMKQGAVLVNTARGEVVDEAALVDALASGHLAAVGLDVYENEPTLHPGLLSQPGAVLLPHLGSATRQTRRAMGMRVLANIAEFLAGKTPADRVV